MMVEECMSVPKMAKKGSKVFISQDQLCDDVRTGSVMLKVIKSVDVVRKWSRWEVIQRHKFQ